MLVKLIELYKIMKIALISSSLGAFFSINKIARLFILLILITLNLSSFATVQRSFINGSLEQPKGGVTSSCMSFLDADSVPGWETTHSFMPNQVTNGCSFTGITPSTGRLMEFWLNSFLGVQPRDGTQLVELNAFEASTIFQKICINKDEDIAWSLSHRARSTVAANRMMFVVGPTIASVAVSNLSTLSSSGNIATLESFSNGTGNVISCQAGSNLTSNSACTKSTFTTSNGTKWMDFAGNFKWKGASAEMFLAFGSVLNDPGTNGSGNLIDNVKVILKPYVEFSSSTVNLANTSVITGPPFGIKVVGEITTPLTVKLSVVGGTAVLGTDFTTPNGLSAFNVTIPVGVYDGSTIIPVGINIIADQASSPNATVNLKIDTDTNYVIASSQTCGGSPVSTSTVKILDAVNVTKTASPANGSKVTLGDTITYTLKAVTDGGPLKKAVVLTDTLSSGLSLVSSSLPSQCTINLQVITCTLPIGTAIGEHNFSYQTTVNSKAELETIPGVKNKVTTSDGNCISCETNHLYTRIKSQKTASPAESVGATLGSFIFYTLSTTVIGQPTDQEIILVDDIKLGLTFKGAVPVGCTFVDPRLTCRLPSGTRPGVYNFVYKTIVNKSIVGTGFNLVNQLIPNIGECSPCKTTHSFIVSNSVKISTEKTANPPSGTAVKVGDNITFKLKASISESVLGEDLVLTDKLGGALDFIQPAPAGCVYSASTVICTLEAGAPIGKYEFEYKAKVNHNSIDGGVTNSVTANIGSCDSCSTEHTTSTVDTYKRVTGVTRNNNTGVYVGDQLDFVLTVNVSNGITINDVILNDTLSEGLVLKDIPEDCVGSDRNLVCTLPIGSSIGTYTFAYSALVTESAADFVSNKVIPSLGTCLLGCETSTQVLRKISLRINKTTNSKQVKIGEYVKYKILIENLQDLTAHNFYLLDQAAPGLSFVEGSLRIKGDNKWQKVQTFPLKIEGLDVAANSKITVEYLMKVNAGAGRGQLCNQALASDSTGNISSNTSKACVSRVSDPDFEDATVLGVVFEDVNNNGIQDPNEPGIPGARLTTATGLVVETDYAGRYHIQGIDTGSLSRGKNYIVKLEMTSLQENYKATTQNPLIKRITWGLPVQFNFGIRSLNSGQ